MKLTIYRSESDVSKKVPMKKTVDPEVTRQKDYITNKLLSVFTLAFIMIFVLMFIGRRMRRADMYYTMFFKGMGVMAAIFAVLMIAGIIFAIVAKKKGINMEYRLFSGKNIAAVSGFIAVCFGALAVSYNEETLALLYVAVAAATVLYIVYHSYVREYFITAATGGIGAIGVWLICRALNGGMGQSKYPILATIVYVLAAAVLILTAIANANGGMVGKMRMYDKENVKYWAVYVAAILVIAALTLALVLGGGAMYAYVLTLLAYVVLTGIIFTVQMI